MRIELNCPYSEKDEAKSLGARWNPAKKVWYIEDIEDLTPFMRWIGRPEHLKPTERQADAKQKHPSSHGPRKNTRPPVITQSRHVPHCGCFDVLPWEDCQHTEAAANLAMREMLSLA